jgi:hypothetical protein
VARPQSCSGVGDQAQAHLVGGDLPVQQPGPRLGVGKGLGEQVVQLDDLHAPVTHLGDEVEVVTAGVLHPQHVVEQQVVAVRGRQALMSQPGGADQDLAQPADFGVHAVLAGRG